MNDDNVPVRAVLKILFLLFIAFMLFKLVILLQDLIAVILGAAMLLYAVLFLLFPEWMRDYTARVVYCIREVLNEG